MDFAIERIDWMENKRLWRATLRYLCAGALIVIGICAPGADALAEEPQKASAQPLSLSVSVSQRSASTGSTIVWTAHPSGGTQPYTLCYSLSMTDANDISTTLIAVCSTAVTFSYTCNKAGTYQMHVALSSMNGGGETVSATSPVTTIRDSSPLGISYIRTSADCAAAGTEMTWRAEAKGGHGTRAYHFLVYLDDVFLESRAYSTDNVFTYAPQTPGNYKIRVYVQDAAETVNEFSDSLEVYAPGEIAITDTASETVGVTAGEALTYTMEAAGEGLRWSITVHSPAASAYKINMYRDGILISEGAPAAENTKSFTLAKSGAYTVIVLIKTETGAYMQTGSAVVVVQAGGEAGESEALHPEQPAAVIADEAAWEIFMADQGRQTSDPCLLARRKSR